MKMIDRLVVHAVLAFLVALPGCTPLVLGGGAAGGYKAATDERTLGRMVDDAALTSKINAALVKDSEVKARKIDVDTVNGLVTLTGVVESDRESRRAAALAKSVPGVRAVDNRLQTGSKSFGRAVDDKLLATSIKSKLIGEPGIRSLNIDVDVDNGVVVLNGIVEDGSQKEKALAIARSASGVVGVVDKLKVSRQ